MPSEYAKSTLMSIESDIALPRIKEAEGFRMYPYKDTVGVTTIGYGCALDVGWPEPFAAAVVKLQVENAAMECQSLPFWSDLDTLRRSAVIEMVFNLGMTKFLQFRKLIAALQKKDYVAAAAEMMSSKWAQQVRGRAIRLAHIMETGVDAPC